MIMSHYKNRIAGACCHLLALLFVFVTCSDGGDEKIPELEKPKLVSSVPADGSENVSTGEQTILLTFDQNIVLASPHEIRLNGGEVTKAAAAFKELTVTAALEKATAYTLVIPAGKVKGPTGVSADEITVRFTTRGSANSTINKTLVSPDPSPEAQRVYDFLVESYGEKIISGVMANVAWNTNEAEWVHTHTGKYPALNCFDYVHLYASPANWINYEDTRVAEEWWGNNGLIAAGWHWNVPAGANSNGHGFYAVGKNGGDGETAFDIRQAVIDGTDENSVIKADLEKIAGNLLLLKEKNIPVIWRPLHEASGKWFWWGAGDAASYRTLWILMFETFKTKGLNNLIWVWTSQTDDYDWYPGDDYVDIIGCDIYNKGLTAVSGIYDSLTDEFPDKLITLSEFGNIAGLSDQWDAGIKWSWTMPWYDYNRTVDPSSAAFNEQTHIHADLQYWEKALENDYVITRDQMPSLK